MSIKTFIFGDVPIALWEWAYISALLIVIFLVARIYKKRHLTDKIEAAVFMPALWLKIVGGLIFGGVYVFYYEGGDTTAYFECALAFSELFWENPTDFALAYFGTPSPELKSLFTADTGTPLRYMYFDPKANMVVRLLVPILIVSAKSYFVATTLVAVLTFGGVWRFYKMLTAYFPNYRKHLALGILFVPSLLFWGSGILKDSFTLAATCYFITAVNGLVLGKKHRIRNVAYLLIASFLIVGIKPYIFILLLPGSLVWVFYERIRRLRNPFFRLVLVPIIYTFVIGLSFGILTTLGETFGRYAPSKALQTAAIIQNDLKQEYYNGNSFDIGSYEATPVGVLSKFPKATMAGLFRPFLWEAKNPLMLVSGLENLLLLLLPCFVFVVLKPKEIWRMLSSHPVLLYCLVFSVLFAFLVGVTTSNFGALVRFKIPLLPCYMGVFSVLGGRAMELLSRKNGTPVSVQRSD